MAAKNAQVMSRDESSVTDNFLNLKNSELEEHLKLFQKKTIIQEQ